jgi:hypothetical protein
LGADGSTVLRGVGLDGLDSSDDAASEGNSRAIELDELRQTFMARTRRFIDIPPNLGPVTVDVPPDLRFDRMSRKYKGIYRAAVTVTCIRDIKFFVCIY